MEFFCPACTKTIHYLDITFSLQTPNDFESRVETFITCEVKNGWKSYSTNTKKIYVPNYPFLIDVLIREKRSARCRWQNSVLQVL